MGSDAPEHRAGAIVAFFEFAHYDFPRISRLSAILIQLCLDGAPLSLFYREVRTWKLLFPFRFESSAKSQLAIPKSVTKRLGITRGAEVKRRGTKPAKVYQVVWVAGPEGFAVLLSAEEEPAKGRGAAYGCQYRSEYVAAMTGLTFVVLDPLSP